MWCYIPSTMLDSLQISHDFPRWTVKEDVHSAHFFSFCSGTTLELVVNFTAVDGKKFKCLTALPLTTFSADLDLSSFSIYSLYISIYVIIYKWFSICLPRFSCASFHMTQSTLLQFSLQPSSRLPNLAKMRARDPLRMCMTFSEWEDNK